MKTTELVLKRIKTVENKRTLGELYVDFAKFTDTLEDVERLFWVGFGSDRKLTGSKVIKETAIPKGRYRVIMTFSTRFKKRLPYLMNVDQFIGILMHGGNTEVDSEGCPLIGEKISDKQIAGAKTKGILDAFCKIVEDATQSGDCYITVI